MLDQNFPPPGPVGRFERFRLWMRARKWRQWLVVSVLFLTGWTALFASWIAVAFLRASTDREAGAVALNFVLVPFMGTVLFFTIHRATYRWFWHLDRKHVMQPLRPADDASFQFGEEVTEPPPLIEWPWSLRLRHLTFYVLGMATLLYVFLPYENQVSIGRFLVQHSVGRASAGSLATMLFGYLPIFVLALFSMLLLSRQTRRRNAGLLNDDEKLVLAAEMNWLFSYATAFGVTMLLCRIFGAMIVKYL